MVKGLYTAHSGMINEMKRLDVLANNLANADTTAYKKEGTTSTTFGEELAVKIRDTSDFGLTKRLGGITYGTKLGQVYTDYTSGSFKVTENKTDFALDGNGFFAIAFTNKNGETSVKYTRDGAFTINNQGYLVTKDGDYVLNRAGALAGNAGAGNYVRVNPNAEIQVDEMGDIYQDNQLVSNIGVVDFADYDYIEKYGENLYNLVDGGQVINSDAKVEQSTLETSNVNVVSEMVNMITIQRAYEAGQKVITSIDSTLDKAVNEVGRVN